VFVDSGISGPSIAPGDHICALYIGDTERDEILFSFLRAGMLEGDKCVCLVDQEPPSYVVDRLVSSGDVPAPRASSDWLEVDECRNAYLPDGRFSPEATIEYLGEKLAMAMQSGRYPKVRAVGEMSWALAQPPGAEQLSHYESEINRTAASSPQILLCMYDLALIGGSVVIDLLKTHPKLVLGGMVLDNPHWLTPDEFVAASA
jgi:hypothetical protein